MLLEALPLVTKSSPNSDLGHVQKTLGTVDLRGVMKTFDLIAYKSIAQCSVVSHG